MVDLGCGPVTQLAQVAKFNPEIAFTGVDLSAGMLQNGREHIAERGLEKCQLRAGRFFKAGEILISLPTR